MKKNKPKLKSPHVWRKNYENKTANECKQQFTTFAQPEFTNWKYEVKLSAEAANAGNL